jgi:hypothetical protein
VIETFDLEAIRAAVAEVDYRRRTAFAAYWARRLLPFYVRFVEKTSRGDRDVVAWSIEKVWSCAAGSQVNRDDVETAQATLVDLTPNIDEPPVLAFAAMECVATSWDALNVCITGSIESTATACTGFSQAVYTYLANRDHRGEIVTSPSRDPLGLERDPIWQQEVRTLNAVIGAVQAPWSVEQINSLRAQAEAPENDWLVDEVVALSARLSRLELRN